MLRAGVSSADQRRAPARAKSRLKRHRGDSTGLAGYAAGTKGVKHEAEQDLNMELAWLEADCERRYLLVIDLDTGDVMTLLMHASELFGDNYSRKLSNIKYSTVTPMAGHALEAQLTGMCWEPAFESPYHVKAAIRTMMPDISSGHLRLILLPVLYNALVEQPQLHETPLYIALHAAIMASSYGPLVHGAGSLFGKAHAGVCTRSVKYSIKTSQADWPPIFQGPQNLTLSVGKYMVLHQELLDSKRLRQSQAEELHSMEAIATTLQGVCERLNAVSERLHIAEEENIAQRADLANMQRLLHRLQPQTFAYPGTPGHVLPAAMPLHQAVALSKATQTEMALPFLDCTPRDCSQDSNDSDATLQGAFNLPQLPLVDRASCTPELKASSSQDISHALSAEEEKLLDSFSQPPYHLPLLHASRGSIADDGLLASTTGLTFKGLPTLSAADLHLGFAAPSAAAYTAAMRGAQDIHPVTSYNAEADPFKLLYQ